jgi:predicted DNA-binding transcriptional regulator AlpA
MTIPANLLTVPDCATRAGIASSTWRAYVSRGQAPKPVTRVGREPLWDVEMVEEWLVGRRNHRVT